MIDINLLSFCFCSAILIYACYSDIKRGRVSNWVWILRIAVGAPTLVTDSWFVVCLFSSHYLHTLSSSILFTFTLSYLFFRLRLFDGADAKCLICLSILRPEQALAQYPFPFALTTLLNAALFSFVTPISLFVYNLLKLSPNELRAHGCGKCGLHQSCYSCCSSQLDSSPPYCMWQFDLLDHVTSLKVKG